MLSTLRDLSRLMRRMQLLSLSMSLSMSLDSVPSVQQQRQPQRLGRILARVREPDNNRSKLGIT
jgi:hypothetical protein